MRNVLTLSAAAVSAFVLADWPTVPALLAVLSVAAGRWWIGELTGPTS